MHPNKGILKVAVVRPGYDARVGCWCSFSLWAHARTQCASILAAQLL